MYILLADDTEDGFHTDSEWNPLLHEYQQVELNTMKMIMVINHQHHDHHGLKRDL